MKKFACSEAAFGSTSRGDSDALSDRDILIVDDDVQVLHRRRIALEASGWSVAAYTFAKLIVLMSNGSLFIQHLKDEATILRDRGGRLRSKLDTFRPKESYGSDLAQNGRLAELAARWPRSRAGALWAADVLYVATRNFGILYLAEKRRYMFSYSSVLAALADEGVIGGNALPTLLKLRFAKSLYRSGERIAVNVADKMIQSAIEVLPERSFPRRSMAWSPADILSSATTLVQGSPAYHRLRNLERTYLAVLALYPSAVASKDLAVLTRWIENPRVYASIAATLEHRLIAQMQYGSSAEKPSVGFRNSPG